MMCQSVISERPDSLISSFKHLGYLRVLNLTHNNIGSEALSHLLPFLTSIEELRSSNSNMSSEGATILSSTLQYLSTLKCLHLF